QCSDSLMNLSSVVFADNGGQSPEDSLSDRFAVFSCSDIVYGCTDSDASNFDELANISDGSCIFPCDGSELIVEINPGTCCAGEHSWELLDDAGVVLLSGGNPYIQDYPLCVPSGEEYTFNTYDFYGDSWDGATYAVYTICDGNLITVVNNGGEVPDNGNYGGYGSNENESSEVFTSIECANITYGCSDPNALNYDATVEYNAPDLCIAVVEGCTDASAANYNAAANTENGSCVSACTDIAVTVIGGGGTIDSWTEFSFYAEEMTYFDDSTYVVDAVDTSYVVSLDSSLVDSAWAYSNDTAMVVSYDTTLVVTLDSILVQNVLLSASRQDVYYNNPNDDIYISDTICIPEGSYVFDPSSYSIYSSSWYGDTFSVDAVCEDGSAILENNGGEQPNPNGDNFIINVLPCSAMTIGCSDSTALNFDAAATHDDGSCIPFIYGCTDSLAVNYNADANTDDGLCADECLDVFVTIDGGSSVSSSNSWTVTNAAESVVASGGSVYSSDIVLDTLCLASGSYSFNSYTSSSYYDDWAGDVYSVFIQGCGSFDSAMVVSYDTALVVTIDSALVDSAWVFTSDSSEVVSADTSLVVTDNTFNVIFANNADESPVDGSMESFSVVSCDDIVFGCNDSIAENYNADATVNDGSCEFIFGCQIDFASNYDSTATVSNDTCYFDASLISPSPGVTLDLVQQDSISLSWDVALDLVGDTVGSYHVYFSSNPNDLGSSDFE
ncbi:MAG: hypothetical protein P8N54_00785, partial [Flavobacteriales bacterium]|nr:hypothetical protein [Flavobacteriales bacterium]